MDRFPEAFRRFEKLVDMRSFKSYRELAYGFSHWANRRWVDSYRQNVALKREAERRGYRVTKIPAYSKRKPEVSTKRTWRRETVTVRGRTQNRYRDLRTGRFIKRQNWD